MVHRVDSEGSIAGQWVEGTPGVPKTLFRAKFFNMLQDELVGLLEAAEIEPDDADDAQISAALDVLFGAGGSAALKNRLINGSLVLWQRGTSFAISNLERYTADRWAAVADQPGAGAGAATISRQAFTAGQTAVAGDPPFFLRWAQSSAATAGAPVLRQKIEDVSNLAGGFATVSFWARADAPIGVTARVVQGFGTGGSADVVATSTLVSIGTAWSRHRVTFAVPSIAGKTVGANSAVRLELVLPFASTFQLDLVDLQVEAGESMTAAERRAFQLEYQLAARYFEKSYPLDVALGTADSEAGRFFGFYVVAGPTWVWRDGYQRFRVRKRVSPTMTWYPTTGTITAGQVSRFASELFSDWTDNVAVALVEGTSDTSTGAPGAATVSGPTQYAAWHWTADAEL